MRPQFFEIPPTFTMFYSMRDTDNKLDNSHFFHVLHASDPENVTEIHLPLSDSFCLRTDTERHTQRM